jgi:hypothetical protein
MFGQRACSFQHSAPYANHHDITAAEVFSRAVVDRTHALGDGLILSMDARNARELEVALEHVRFTGVGERVDTSMVGALTALVAIEPFDLLKGMGVPYRTGKTMARLGTFGVYDCADGYVAIMAGGSQANALFKAAGKPGLADDPRSRASRACATIAS